MRGFWLGSTAVAAAIIGSNSWSAAMAQTATTQTATDQSAAGQSASAAPGIGEVIVWARRVNENQQDVPVAVTAISGDALRADTVTRIDDLQHNAPSLEIDPSSFGGDADPRFTVRGLSGELVTDPSVVAYFDEVPSDPRSFAYTLYDLDSVQVLKGPQGTLFGKNSTGGAVLFAPTRPGPEFGGYVDLRYGSFNDREFTGAVNLPIRPSLLLRVAGEIEGRDGTVESVAGGFKYDNRNHGSVRAELTFKPSDRFENYLQATYYQVRQINNQPILTGVAPCTAGAGGLAPICFFSSATGVLPGLPPTIPTNLATGAPDIAAEFAEQQALGKDKTVNAYRGAFDVDFEAATDISTYRLGGVTLKNIAHLDYARYQVGIDLTGTGSSLLDQASDQKAHDYSDELQILDKAFDDRLSSIFGLFYSNSSGGQHNSYNLVGYPGNPLFGFPANPVSPQTVALSAPQTSTAVFGQATYDFPGPASGFSITAGYRHTWDQRAFTQQRLQPGNATLGVPTCALLGFPGLDPTTCVEHLSARFGAYNYDVSLNWRPAKALLVYVASRRGYKAGGFNFAATDPSFIQYAPEYVTDVEVGVKTDWRLAGVSVRANLAGYVAKYENIQAQFVLQSPSGLPEAVVVNQDPVTGQQNKATLDGGEAELVAAPTRELQVNAYIGYADSRYDQFTSEQSAGGVTATINLKGQPIAGTARTTAGTVLTYAPDVPDAWGRPSLTANLYTRSAQTSNVLEPFRIGGYTAMDLRLDWRNFGGRPLDISIYGNNVTDNRHLIMAEDLTSVVGVSSVEWSEPAVYGVELRYHFGASR